ncbi:hypothetical protein D7V94_15245 [Parablautia intestinalis]|uniref:DUF4352 domain-containing protein n=1 Tax=Parablautia intestinalis TaxID=2320100 RepID=A0A3A9AFZ5_9FIRM|nr:hypothetical protein [Parablautia intestinalis]RKI90208.1 hypothetical protein D7V94_15245 [Parablautia intestinalis]
MKKNKMKYGVIVLLVALLTTGCGNKIPELSEQEQELVVEYAREVVLKHDKNYQSRLVDLSLEQENVNEAEPETPSEEEDEASSDAKETDGQEVSVTDNTQTEVQNVTLEEFLKLDDVKFTYNGYELDNFYPQQGEELYFIMEATQGSKLLVLKFLAENTSGTEINLDIAKTETRFKIIADGVGKNALTTMLLNDLTYYQGTIAPGENVELVLVCEIPEEQTEISTLELTIKSVDDSATISLN